MWVVNVFIAGLVLGILIDTIFQYRLTQRKLDPIIPLFLVVAFLMNVLAACIHLWR